VGEGVFLHWWVHPPVQKHPQEKAALAAYFGDSAETRQFSTGFKRKA
jgi:hypothetical protein